MKKILAGLILAGGSLFAGTHFSIGIGIGVPVAPAPVYVAPAPAYVAPAPAYVDPYAVPPMPAPGYTWVGGYWYVSGGHRLWHAGFWRAPEYREHFEHRDFDHDHFDHDRGHFDHDRGRR